jgi:hypothetical protein
VKSAKQEIGRLWETLFQKLYGGRKQPASGSTPYYKLDIEGDSLLWSLKATSNESFRITKSDLTEAYDAVKGPGGTGADIIPAMAICFVEGSEPKPSDTQIAILFLDDFVRLLKEHPELFELSKSEIKIATSKIPAILRDLDIKKDPDSEN